MKQILVFLLSVFISVLVGTVVAKGIFISKSVEQDVSVRAFNKDLSSFTTQQACSHFMKDLMEKKSFDTVFGETIADSFLESCPEEVQVFPFQEPIWVFTLNGVQSGRLILGYMALENNMYGRIKTLSNDRLIVEFSNKETVEYVKHQGVFMPDSRVVQFVHPSWQDFVLIEGNQLIRLSKNKGTIVSKMPDEIKVKWNGYGVETFVLTHDKWYLKK